MISFIEQPNDWRDFVTSHLQFSKLPQLLDDFPQEKNQKQKHLANINPALVDKDLHSPSFLVSVSNRLKNISSLTSALDLSSLKFLNISFNGLKSIPSCLDSLINLEELDISHNKLESLDFIEPLTSLRVLRAHHNRLESILPISFIGNLLEELWISENKLDWLEYAFIRDCKLLRVLIKYGNPSDNKAKLAEFLVYHLSSLQILDDKLIANGEFVRMDGGDVEDDISDSNPISKSNNANRRSSARPSAESKPTVAVSSSASSSNNEKISTDLRVMITQAKAHYQQHLAIYQQQRESQDTTFTDDNAFIGTNPSGNTANGGKVTLNKFTRSHSTRSLSSLQNDQESNDLDKATVGSVTPKSGPRNVSKQRPLRSSSKDSVYIEANLSDKRKKSNRKITLLVHFPSSEPSLSRSRTNSIDEGDQTPTVLRESSHRPQSTNKKVAFCQYSSGEGIFRWQVNGSAACRLEQQQDSPQLITATYPDGTSAAVIEVCPSAQINSQDKNLPMELCEGKLVSWQLCDPQGRTLCATSPSGTALSSTVVSVFDPETNAEIERFPYSPDRSNDKDKVFQWVFPVSVMAIEDGSVSLSYTPHTGEVVVEVSQLTLGKAVVSSSKGLQLFPTHPNEVVHGSNNTTRRHSNTSAVGFPPRSSSTGKASSGKEPGEFSNSSTNHSESTNTRNPSNTRGRNKNHEITTSELPQLSELNANLDNLLGDIKQLKENASSSLKKKK